MCVTSLVLICAHGFTGTVDMMKICWDSSVPAVRTQPQCFNILTALDSVSIKFYFSTCAKSCSVG